MVGDWEINPEWPTDGRKTDGYFQEEPRATSSRELVRVDDWYFFVGSGQTSHTKVWHFNSASTLLIVSGAPYIVEPFRKSVRTAGKVEETIYWTLFCEATSFVIAQSHWSGVLAFSSQGLAWRFDDYEIHLGYSLAIEGSQVIMTTEPDYDGLRFRLILDSTTGEVLERQKT